MFFVSCFAKNIEFQKLILNNEITLTIIGKGDKVFLNDNIETPSEIYLNNILQSGVEKTLYNLTEETNTIRIVWDSPIINCNLMFQNLIDITDIVFLFVQRKILPT